ncbi:NfeD family protein [Aquisalimonas lutea]|uniref:NfeD family protein n=1 Tax=Aquisalimonas lutea TaxID=1327750 RepID=UPI0025B603EA|nr:NfeD family protein [Aquisalimonas lutea]MDN3518686.1 NfeD family protein [Aquisalimonas lutea]
MTGPESRIRTFAAAPLVRYVLLQVPGALVLVCVLYILVDHGWLDTTAGLWVLGLWVAKDAALYPLYRPALTTLPQHSGGSELLGATGRTRTEVAASGLIVVNGEFWRARSAAAPIPPRTPVRVRGADGRVLVVEPAPPGRTRGDD